MMILLSVMDRGGSLTYGQLFLMLTIAWVLHDLILAWSKWVVSVPQEPPLERSIRRRWKVAVGSVTSLGTILLSVPLFNIAFVQGMGYLFVSLLLMANCLLYDAVLMSLARVRPALVNADRSPTAKYDGAERIR